MNKLVDIGANLAHDSFDDDRNTVIAAARDAGVGAIVVTGSSVSSSGDALDWPASGRAIFFQLPDCTRITPATWIPTQSVSSAGRPGRRKSWL